MKLINYKIFLTVAIAATLASGVAAEDRTVASPAMGILSTVTSAELPAKAAELVTQAAGAKNLHQITIEVVKTAVGLNPASAPAIVGSIALASPDMAATASAKAVALVPNQVLAIARAAAAACPAKAGAIVEAICRVLPADYRQVAEAVAEVVPGADKEILAAVSAAIPDLSKAIDQALSSYQVGISSITTVLGQVAQTQPSAATLAALSSPSGVTTPSSPTSPISLPRGPTVTAPSVPISGTPITILPGNGSPVPTGTRGYNGDYSAP